MNVENTIDKLYSELKNSSENNLNEHQLNQLKYACKKSVLENPTLEFEDLKIAGKIYLNLIISFPSMNLGGINI